MPQTALHQRMISPFVIRSPCARMPCAVCRVPCALRPAATVEPSPFRSAGLSHHFEKSRHARWQLSYIADMMGALCT